MHDDDIPGILDDALAVIDLPPGALANALDLLGKDRDLDAFNAPKLLGVSEHKAEPLLHLLAHKGVGKRHLLILLKAMMAMKDRASGPAEEVELCWTGPPRLGVMEMSTDSVISDMIGKARREILVVGYMITDGGDTIKMLADAAGRVDDMIIVIDNDRHRVNITSISNAFKGIRMPRIYTHREEDGFYKVHAKVLITDGMEMLLTSANMTHHGMRRNFEMGVRIKGGPAADARTLIMKMIDNGYFEEAA